MIFGNLIRNLKSNKSQNITVKCEIDYDKLAEKIAQAITSQQPVIKEDEIKNAVIAANKKIKETEDNEPLTSVSSLMRGTLFAFYGFIFLFGCVVDGVYCYYNSLYGTKLKEWVAFSVVFSFCAWFAAIAFIAELKTKSNNAVNQHFTFFVSMAALLLAILAL